MLGRIPTGSAFAALPLAALLTAAAQGWGWLVLMAATVFALSMVWTFAPWIPWLKDQLPARKRVECLGRAWTSGQRLILREVTTQPDLATWTEDVSKWERETQEWIADSIDTAESLRFFQPHYYAVSDALGDSFDDDHQFIKNRIVHQLNELIRLRDEQERSLH